MLQNVHIDQSLKLTIFVINIVKITFPIICAFSRNNACIIILFAFIPLPFLFLSLSLQVSFLYIQHVQVQYMRARARAYDLRKLEQRGNFIPSPLFAIRTRAACFLSIFPSRVDWLRKKRGRKGKKRN